jgi:hypothetical protein
MGSALTMRVRGMEQLTRTIGLMENAVRDPSPIFRAILRPYKPPGFPRVIVRRGYSFTEIVEQKFAREGRSLIDGAVWVDYANEPRYAAMKKRQGGGEQIGIWEGSKSPLDQTFGLTPYNRDAVWSAQPGPIPEAPGVGSRMAARTGVEGVEQYGPWGFRFGSLRYYASTFDSGGVMQPWDKVPQPARPVLVVNERVALELARGFQRYVVYLIDLRGGHPSEFGLLRVDP